jgi:hypothetical protein
MSFRAFIVPALAVSLALAAAWDHRSTGVAHVGRVELVTRAADGQTPVRGRFTLSALDRDSSTRVSLIAAGRGSFGVALPAGAYAVEWSPEVSPATTPSELESALEGAVALPRVIVVAPSQVTMLVIRTAARESAAIALAE